MTNHEEFEQPRVNDKRKIDPVTGEPREQASAGSEADPSQAAAQGDAQAAGASATPQGEAGGEGQTAHASATTAGQADGADGAAGDAPAAAAADAGAPATASDDLSDADRALLEGEAAAIDAERAALEAKSAQQLDELQRLRADYVNYRNRTERDRAGDRETTTASVIQKMLPALDDLDLAEKHGDLAEGPLAIVAAKLRASFDQLGVVKLGEVGEVFDIDKHEAVAQLPNPEVTEMVVADVVQSGYRVGARVLRAAKVAVFVPAE